MSGETTRGLVAADLVRVPPPNEEATFQWHTQPTGGICEGTIYPDGSRLDGPSNETARNGWSFVIFDENTKTVTASANGIPPDWVQDIPATEAWAIYQALMYSVPGHKCLSDCLGCIKAIWNGRDWAVSAGKKHARVHRLLHHVIDDSDHHLFQWMPAHCSIDQVGKRELSDGSLLSQDNITCSDIADRLAKEAAEQHRVPEPIRDGISERDKHAVEVAVWVGIAGYLANHANGGQATDSFPHDARKTRGHKINRGQWRRPRRAELDPDLGGHDLSFNTVLGRWTCRFCGRWTKVKSRIAHRRCNGTPVSEWAAGMLNDRPHQGAQHIEHVRMCSGGITWCAVCGSYAGAKAVYLKKACPGPARGHTNGKGKLRGGRLQQLRLLTAGLASCHHRARRSASARRPRTPSCHKGCRQACRVITEGCKKKQQTREATSPASPCFECGRHW